MEITRTDIPCSIHQTCLLQIARSPGEESSNDYDNEGSYEDTGIHQCCLLQTASFRMGRTQGTSTATKGMTRKHRLTNLSLIALHGLQSCIILHLLLLDVCAG